MSERLKPCPFCGGEAAYYPNIYAPGGSIFCLNRDCILHIRIEFHSKEEAYQTWNTRPDLRASGEWILHIDEETNAWECSLCHEVYQLMDGTPEENHMHYCHNCGAKMSTEENHDAHA